MHGEPILFIEPAHVEGDEVEEEDEIDLDHIRPDLAEVIARHANTLDENRPASVGAAARPISAPHAKILRNWSMRDRSSNTDRWRLPRSAVAVVSTI